MRKLMDKEMEIYLEQLKIALTGYQGDDARTDGRDIPATAETMIGLKRLENIQYCAVDVLKKDIPGDFIETGVWRGGACIFMRAILKAFEDKERKVWAADSFSGFPSPDPERYPADAKSGWASRFPQLAVSLDVVKQNFANYGLLDEQVCFLPGWFRDTLPNAPIDRLALLRLDGDLYESTIIALESLYPRLSAGGYLIVDDYGCFPACRRAVTDFREQFGIIAPIQKVDWTGVFWQK
jgi:O-methyltransferase